MGKGKQVRIIAYILYDSLVAKSLPIFDIGILYLYSWRLREKIIEYLFPGIINFHPELLTVHKSVAVCCYALLNEYDKWAVTIHYIAVGFDKCNVIEEADNNKKKGKVVYSVMNASYKEK